MPGDLQFQYFWRRQLDGCRVVAQNAAGQTVATLTLEIGPAYRGDCGKAKDEIEAHLRTALAKVATTAG